MCVLVVINRGEKEIEGTEAFKFHFGFYPVSNHPYMESLQDECLCNSDLDATFQLKEIPYKTSQGDYFVGDLENVKGDDD